MKKKKSWNVYKIGEEVHVFNVWTIIVQMLNINIKDWKLLELQITQTRHPLRILDGKNFKFNMRTDKQTEWTHY